MSRPCSPSPSLASRLRVDDGVGSALTVSEPPACPARGRPGASPLPTWRAHRRLALLAILIAGSWLVASLIVRPIDQTCDPALARDVCLETIDAALRRGLPVIHPLLLAAHAEPGPAARTDQFGHRATVTFLVLGVPGPVRVRLFFDAGAHWGGIPDHRLPELAAWTLGGALVLAVAIAAAGIGLARLLCRSRRSG